MIPAKAFRLSKHRLSALLTEGERVELSAALLRHTIAVVRQAFQASPLIVVASGEDAAEVARQSGVDKVFLATGEGLNEQLAEAAASIPADAELLTLHADLPMIQSADLLAINAHDRAILLAPDRHGTGTNAMLQRGPDRFFLFGKESLRRHRQEAKRRGLTCGLVESAGLAQDLDDPDDWHRTMGNVTWPLPQALKARRAPLSIGSRQDRKTSRPS